MNNKNNHEVNHKLEFYNLLEIFYKYTGWCGSNITHQRISVLLIAMIATIQVGAADVITVGNTSDTDYLNIQNAINAANDGDIIRQCARLDRIINCFDKSNSYSRLQMQILIFF